MLRPINGHTPRKLPVKRHFGGNLSLHRTSSFNILPYICNKINSFELFIHTNFSSQNRSRLCTLNKIPPFLLIFSPKNRKIGVLAEVFAGILLVIYKKIRADSPTKRPSAHTRTRIYNKKEGNRHSDFFLILSAKDNNALPLNGISGYR